MAKMPDIRWEGEHAPIQPNGQRRLMTRYDIVCVHTIVGQAPAHAAHFSTWADGTILQSRDTLYQSGANLEGNHRVIAIENADMPPTWNTADGHAVPAMTAAQVEACARIAAWAHQTHGIPLVANPDSRPESRGVGYHRQGVDGNFGSYAYPGRVAGGELWTATPGKVCPGDRRISQISQIISRAHELLTPESPDPERHDMLFRDVNNGNVFLGGPGYFVYVGDPIAYEVLARPEAYGPAIDVNTVQVDAVKAAFLSGQAASDDEAAALSTQVAALVLDVDEAALAADLAPLLSGVVTTVSDADLARIATAVADEQARRQVA